MALTYKEYDLNELSIEEISARLLSYLDDLKLEKKDIGRLRLMTEELLLNIMEGCGKGICLSFGIGKRFGRHILSLRYTAAPFDPTTGSENSWSDDIMRVLGFSPVWNHKGTVNTVSLVLSERKKRSMIFYMLLAVFCSVLIGMAGRMLPEASRQVIDEVLLTPVANGFMGLLKAFSGIMILFAICSGITGMGGLETLGRTGRSITLRTAAVSVALTVITIVLILPFLHFEIVTGMQGDSGQLKAISRMIFDILPSDPVEPFRSGNFIQIIVIALFIGTALLAIGERGGRIRGLIDDMAALTQQIITAVSSFIPIYVFAMLVRYIWLGNTGTLLTVWKPILIMIFFYLALTSVSCLNTALRLKCAPAKLFKTVFPPFLIGLTTASSLSAMAISMDTCENKFGIHRKMVSFLYPLDSMFYKPLSIIYFTVLSLVFAETCGVDVSLSWMLMAGILCLLLSIAVPPIPGAGLMVYSILFSSLGIPLEAILMATAVEMILEHLYTGCTIALQIFHIVNESSRLGYMDKEVFEQQCGKE